MVQLWNASMGCRRPRFQAGGNSPEPVAASRGVRTQAAASAASRTMYMARWVQARRAGRVTVAAVIGLRPQSGWRPAAGMSPRRYRARAGRLLDQRTQHAFAVDTADAAR